MNDEANATVAVVGDASVLHLDGPSFRIRSNAEKIGSMCRFTLHRPRFCFHACVCFAQCLQNPPKLRFAHIFREDGREDYIPQLFVEAVEIVAFLP